ncbi:hypothetical protein LINPERHAP1_LOCUS25068 [Linum perenne]
MRYSACSRGHWITWEA